MGRVRIGLTCEAGHFNEIGHLWEPVKDKDIDKLAERARLPECCNVAVLPGSGELDGDIAFGCRKPLGLPHVEGRDREENRLARVGGRNISAPMQSRQKPRPKEGPLTPEQWKWAVWQQQGGAGSRQATCAVTGLNCSFAYDDAHHVLDKRLLRARGLYHLVWDPRNGMFIRRNVHESHTLRSKPITRDKIPAAAWAFARELGDWAVQRLEDDYPTSSTTPNPTTKKGAG